VFLACLLAAACRPAKADPVVLAVGNMKVTRSEFESAFAASPYAQKDNPEGRREFVESYALRMMILKEARAEGLDRDPVFLKEIEAFWRQALVKLMIQRKAAQARKGLKVSDEEIAAYYQANSGQCCPGKTLEESRPHIAAILAMRKKQQIIEGWLEYIKSKATVKVNKALIGLK